MIFVVTFSKKLERIISNTNISKEVTEIGEIFEANMQSSLFPF